MQLWYEDMVTATARLDLPIAYREDTGALLRDAGFTNISELTIQVPFSELRPDPYERELAVWLRTAMGDVTSKAYQGLSMLPLTHELGYSPERVDRLCEEATKVLNRSRIPLYYNL